MVKAEGFGLGGILLFGLVPMARCVLGSSDESTGPPGHFSGGVVCAMPLVEGVRHIGWVPFSLGRLLAVSFGVSRKLSFVGC